MRLFRKKYKDENGAVCELARWYAEFRDHAGSKRRCPLFTDERASQAFAQRLEELVSCRVGGVEPDKALSEWCFALPKEHRERLAQWGLLDARRASAAVTLTEHVAEWKQALEAKGNTSDYVSLRVFRVESALKACGFIHWQDINAEAVEAHLEELRTRKDNDISAQTSNFYLQALKSFCVWMIKRGRAMSLPLVSLTPQKKSALVKDARHKRRALTVKELSALIVATRAAPARFGMTGAERALAYTVAVETGLRSSEVASLTRNSFYLDARPPFVIVDAASTKNADEARLPLRETTAAAILDHVKNKLPQAKAFNFPPKWDVIDMFKADLEAAQIDYVDAQARHADFHALRHTFGTNLAAGGVHPKTAQDLMRHSDIRLTMQLYTHTLVEQRNDAVAKLPSLDILDAAAVKTGTDNAVLVNRSMDLNRTEYKATRRTPADSVTHEDSPRHLSSVVEQRFCNSEVESSNIKPIQNIIESRKSGEPSGEPFSPKKAMTADELCKVVERADVPSHLKAAILALLKTVS